MKNLSYYLLSICLILLALSGCGSDSSTGPGSDPNPDPDVNPASAPTIKKMTDVFNVSRDAGMVYRDALERNGDSLAALQAMRTWIDDNPAVDKASYDDPELIEIYYKNGLKSSILITTIDKNGIALTRGGGTTSGLAKFNFKAEDDKKPREIKNDNVMVFMPFPSEFGYESEDIATMRARFKDANLNADFLLGDDYDFENNDQPDLNDIKRLGDYGLIILDTHGVKNGFVLGKYMDKVDSTTFVEDDVRKKFLEILKIPAEKIENGEIEISLNIQYDDAYRFDDDLNEIDFRAAEFQIEAVVTEKYIRNLGLDLSDAVIFGNHCFSGYTADGPNKNNMPEAWHSKGAATYYGYAFDDGTSVNVDNDFAKNMEKVLIKRLVEDSDTTGAANLKNDGSKYFYVPGNRKKDLYFNQYFDTDYSYDNCGDLTDSRDNEVYKLACIGDQKWMAENLRYEASGRKKPGDKDIAKYGYLYNYNTVTAGGAVWHEGDKSIQGICPTGWHVPHRTDWKQFFKELGSETDEFFKVNTDSMLKTIIRLYGPDPNLQDYEKYKNDPKFNSSGFTALATGFGSMAADGTGGAYIYHNDGRPIFWSSSPLGKNSKGVYNTDARFVVRFDTNFLPNESLGLALDIVDFYVPVRCIEDKEK